METIAIVETLTHQYNHMWGGGSGWMWLWGTLMMLAIIGAVVAGIWFIVRSTRRPGNRAHEILAERYARGELSTDEYRERLAELK